MDLKEIKRVITNTEAFEARLNSILMASELEYVIKSAVENEDPYIDGAVTVAMKIAELDLLLSMIKLMESKEQGLRDTAYNNIYMRCIRLQDSDNPMKASAMKIYERSVDLFCQRDEEVVLREKILDRLRNRRIIVESLITLLKSVQEAIKLQLIHGKENIAVGLTHEDLDIMFEVKKLLAMTKQ